MNGLKISLLLSIFWVGALGRDMSLEEFSKLVERNSIELIGKKAEFESLLENQRSLIAWDYPYVETDVSMVKNNQGRLEPQTTALLMLVPKLPWVSTMLYQSLHIKTAEYKKSYELSKNLVFIAAKRLYLNYVITKEKYDIYTQRENNYLSQLKIAKEKVDAGSMSKKDYINFKNSYLESRLAKTNVESTLISLEKTLDTLLAIEEMNPDNANFGVFLDDAHRINVIGLGFEYVHMGDLELKKILDHSLYAGIIDLQAKDYQTNAKLANRDRFSALEVGAGVENANSSTNVSLRVSIPLPVTPKNTHLKRKYMALQSGALAQSEVIKRNIRIQTNSYMSQLTNKEKYIRIQKENIKNKKHLMQMGKVAYEAQKIGLFEYLIYQNSYMDALIALADAKLDYVNTTALLEETLGQSLPNQTSENQAFSNTGEK
ncbi:TolC family protein [Helicobacter sp. 11S02596-1]|uniref:TolC family protein n=1 Tax=Helicobacter sp. 11S02596-1 TaxID=1476194 RepID=UPI000BA7A2E6|nr:TolC family protein [Helicobacter sp. 11S02596-1]